MHAYLTHIKNIIYKKTWQRDEKFQVRHTSLETEAICPSSIHVSVTTSVSEPPAKNSITTCNKKNKNITILSGNHSFSTYTKFSDNE